MYQSALLLLTGSLRVVSESIGHFLTTANKQVAKRLYVKIEPELCNPFSKSDAANIGRISALVPLVYCKASTICRNVDVRVLLTNVLQAKLSNNKLPRFDAVFTNSSDDSNLYSYVELNFDNKNFDIIKLDNYDYTAKEDCYPITDYQVFKTVALGGTFDRLHNGHKVLLSEGALRATEKLIVGVSDLNMLKRKVLFELIEPVDKRISAVTDFLLEMDPSISYEVVPITDPFGPTIAEPNIDCIVVTTETKIGGEKVNFEREKKGMHELTMHVCDLVENTHHSADEEEKLSSSTKRMHVLGMPLNNIQNPPTHGQPYHILLKGNSTADKTFIANQFEAFGVKVVNCDKTFMHIVNKNLTSKTYATNNGSFNSVICDGSVLVDYDKLLSLCLRNKDFKKWIVEIGFNDTKSELKKILKSYSTEGSPAVILVDSSLFNAHDLDIEVQENWTIIMPESEHMTYLKEHFNFNDEEATNILKTFPSNDENIKVSNIVFCNKWSADTTHLQIDKAWNYLKTKLSF